MGALVTIDLAKEQLEIPEDDHSKDEKVARKIEHASGVILDYLKGRANKTATITSSSVASPTVITTSADHMFVNGETVVIAGHEDSTPTLNGSWEVSNVLEDSFTIPAAVTVAGTGGTATVLWTPETVPFQVQAAVLVMLTHLYEHRGDDMASDEQTWAAIRRLLERSRDPAYA